MNVVFHHWTDICIYFLVYDMHELNLGLVLEYVQNCQFCDLLLYFQIQYARIYCILRSVCFYYTCCMYFIVFYLCIHLFLHALTRNISKENPSTYKCKVNFCQTLNVMAHGAPVCCNSYVTSCATTNILLPSCFFQSSLLPCLQQIQKLMGMVRKRATFILTCLSIIYFCSSKRMV